MVYNARVTHLEGYVLKLTLPGHYGIARCEIIATFLAF